MITTHCALITLLFPVLKAFTIVLDLSALPTSIFRQANLVILKDKQHSAACDYIHLFPLFP